MLHSADKCRAPALHGSRTQWLQAAGRGQAPACGTSASHAGQLTAYGSIGLNKQHPLRAPCEYGYILLAAAGWPLQASVDMLCHIARPQPQSRGNPMSSDELPLTCMSSALSRSDSCTGLISVLSQSPLACVHSSSHQCTYPSGCSSTVREHTCTHYTYSWNAQIA